MSLLWMLHFRLEKGYRSIEHIKRYTAMGFGTDQGKTGNINGIAVAAEFLDCTYVRGRNNNI